MLDADKVFKGQFVHYIPRHDGGKPENGIVKSLHPDGEKAWVVYSWGDDYNDYEQYTGQLTDLKQLRGGWI